MFSASVVITTKNRKEELLKAVESAMGQRCLLEVIVIDDGSTDGTADELKKKFSVFSSQFSEEEPATSYSPPVTTSLPVLRLIRHEESRGLIVRRNEGARVARGDVIFSMDDDAVFSSPFVVEQTLRDFSHPRIGAVAIPYIEPHKANREIQRAPTREDIWITASYIGTAHAVRRDIFLALGGYREHLVHQGEEGDFCLRMLAAKHGGEEILTTEDTTERLGGREMEQPKVGPKGEGVGTTESKITEEEAGLTTDDTDGHGYSAGLHPGSRAGTAFSNPSTSELALNSENTSLNRSASGPAGALRSGEIGSGGEDQLADSGKFLEGQSQAGLQIGSQKHPNPCAAMGSTTSGDNSSSVPIREIRGKKNSGAQEALDASLPATSYSPLVTPLEAAVPGFFVRLGNSDLIVHNESPKRDYSRMDFYGRRNDVLFHWQNTPMPDLIWQLPMTIAGGLLCAYRVKRWRKMLEGIGAGFLAIVGGVKREPVLREVVKVIKSLKKECQILLQAESSLL
jgi:hypothetical protein